MYRVKYTEHHQVHSCLSSNVMLRDIAKESIYTDFWRDWHGLVLRMPTFHCAVPDMEPTKVSPTVSSVPCAASSQ